MPGFIAISDVLLLIALGIGYIVLFFAKREEKWLQFIGYVIGCAVIILATIYILSNYWIQSQIRCPKMHGYKGKMFNHMMQQRMMQPKATPQAPSQSQ